MYTHRSPTLADLTYHLTPKQTVAYQHLTSPDPTKVLFGGAKGGGKSFLLSLWIDVWVDTLIRLFRLSPSENPVPLGFIGRKQSVDFTSTTLETFKRVVPPDHYRIREREIIFHNTAKVFFGGLDDQRRIHKFNSAEFAFFALDQAEETERTDVNVLQASLRLKLGDITPPYKQLYTANPADCWLKEDYIDNQRGIYVPALHSENPHLPDSYGETLTSAFQHNDAMLQAYLHGNWYALQASNALISSQMLDCLKTTHLYPKDIRRIIACDPSLGGDECVVYALENGRVLEECILHERDTMKIAGQMQILGRKHNTPCFVIDQIGIGQGVYDRLRELKKGATVLGIHSASESTYPERYANIRAEMWWYTMVQIQERRIPYPEDPELRRQLTSMRFKVVNSNGKTLMEPKEKTKQRLGRSPDRGDAFVYGLWALSKVPPITHKDAWDTNTRFSAVESAVTDCMVA
jgi:hypothetical protein